jgi:hypothetical protein
VPFGTEESLLVLQGLGIQTSTSSGYFFTAPTTTFIPTAQIQDIVIHEAFKGLGVRFYLAVIVEGGTEVVVVFPVSDCWLKCNACLSFEAGAVYTDIVSHRHSCPDARSSKKSGAVLVNVYTLASIEFFD